MKFLNFSVSETSGRTFDIPLEKAIEIIKKLQKEDDFLNEEVDFTDSESIAEFFTNNGLLDEISNFETQNDYTEVFVVDDKITESVVKE